MNATSPHQETSSTDFSAIIVAGGRSSRLGGTPKASLSNGEKTLLASTLEAVQSAQEIVVVGPEILPLPPHVVRVREDPPFSGPAAAITAGIRAFAQKSEWTCVLAVDMPAAATAVAHLVQATEAAPRILEGFVGVTEGITQPLASIFRTEALMRVFATDTTHQSVRKFIRQLNTVELELPAEATEDVDTWDNAHRLGFEHPQWNES